MWFKESTNDLFWRPFHSQGCKTALHQSCHDKLANNLAKHLMNCPTQKWCVPLITFQPSFALLTSSPHFHVPDAWRGAGVTKPRAFPSPMHRIKQLVSALSWHAVDDGNSPCFPLISTPIIFMFVMQQGLKARRTEYITHQAQVPGGSDAVRTWLELHWWISHFWYFTASVERISENTIYHFFCGFTTYQLSVDIFNFN